MSDLGRVVREEAWRSVAWFVLSALAWSFVVSSAGELDATTGAVLVLATTLALFCLTVGVRLATGRELRSADGTPPLLYVIGVGALAGIEAVSLVAAHGFSPLLLVGYLVVFAVVLVVADRVLPRSD